MPNKSSKIRMAYELSDIQKRTQKLEEFTKSDYFRFLGEAERKATLAQLRHMIGYAFYLEKRYNIIINQTNH